jgi:hypothetical protein
MGAEVAGWTVAVIGGDRRMPEIMRQARAAETLRREVIWARGQAGTAPKRTGYDEWQVIMRMVRERVPEPARA